MSAVKNKSMLVLGLLVAALFVLVQVLFIVHEGEVVIRTTFGKPDPAPLDRPGLYARWPWPVQALDRYDARMQVLDGTFEQTLTRDGKTVIAKLYASWRIAEPLLFRQRVGSMAQAALNLNGLLSNTKIAVLGQYPLSALVNVDPAAFQFETVEADMLRAAAPEARARYGIELAVVGIRKLTLPEAVTEQVYRRQRAEREEVAERYRSEGEGESIRIRAEADSEREKILARAHAEARAIRAEGDAAAAGFYSVFARDPELAMFLRKLESMEVMLGQKATVVLSPETEPFDLLRAPAGEKKMPGAAEVPGAATPDQGR